MKPYLVLGFRMSASTLSRPELLCFAAFIILGVFVVLAIRHPREALTGFVTIPIAGLCGGSSYLIARLMYSPRVGTLYGLAAFAFTGLIVVSVLRWVASMDKK
jgi:predicted membrane channel-forming protein YqfA (hemolysin III family)